MGWKQKLAIIGSVIAGLAVILYIIWKYFHGLWQKLFGWTGMVVKAAKYPGAAHIIYRDSDMNAANLLEGYFPDAVDDPVPGDNVAGTPATQEPADAATNNCIYIGGPDALAFLATEFGSAMPTVTATGMSGNGVYANNKRCQLQATRTNGTIIIALFGWNANDTYNTVKDFIEANTI